MVSPANPSNLTPPDLHPVTKTFAQKVIGAINAVYPVVQPARGVILAVNDDVEIDTLGLPAVNLNVLENTDVTFVFEQFNGAWVSLTATNLVTGVAEAGGAGITGMWTAHLGSTSTKARIRCTVIGAAPEAYVALSLPTPVTPALLAPTSQLVQRAIVWRPAGVAGPGVATTWAAVMAFVAESDAPSTIWIDLQGTVGGYAVVPAGTYDMKHATISGFNRGFSNFGQNSIAISDGAVLKNLAAFMDEVQVECRTSTVGAPNLDWDVPVAPVGGFIQFVLGRSVRVTVAGTQPAIIVDPARFSFVLRWENGAFFQQTGVLATKFIQVKPNGFCGLTFVASGTGTAWFPFIIGAVDATSAVAVQFIGDGSAPTPTTWLATFATNKITVSTPQGLLMTTADRNAINISKNVGDWYFDATALKPVYWTGAAWVDAVGTPVP